MCEDHAILKIMTSSRYASQKSSNPAKTFFTSLLKDPGAFRRPNGIYFHWKWPLGVTKAVSSTAAGATGICQYPLVMSNFVRNLACPILFIRVSTLGIGKGSGIVTEFSFLKSVHKRNEPSGLGTKTIGAAHGLSDSSIIPNCNNSFISRFTTSNRSG